MVIGLGRMGLAASRMVRLARSDMLYGKYPHYIFHRDGQSFAHFAKIAVYALHAGIDFWLYLGPWKG